jgi:hypothetical protein
MRSDDLIGNRDSETVKIEERAPTRTGRLAHSVRLSDQAIENRV